MHAAEAVRDTLVEADPDHAEEYKAQAEAYLAKLEALDAEVREKIWRFRKQAGYWLRRMMHLDISVRLMA